MATEWAGTLGRARLRRLPRLCLLALPLLLAASLFVVAGSGSEHADRRKREGRDDRQPSLEEQIADDPAFAHLRYERGRGPVPGVRSWWRR